MRPPQRLARSDDIPAIDELMKRSIADLFPAFYNETQTAASVRYIGAVDPMLVDDGTYFVVEAGDGLVACGGWSRRDKLYTGSGAGPNDARLLDPATEPARVRAMFVRGDWTRRGLGWAILEACQEAAQSDGFTMLALMSTLPGRPLYAAFGFGVLEDVEIPMPDGTLIAGTRMEKEI